MRASLLQPAQHAPRQSAASAESAANGSWIDPRGLARPDHDRPQRPRLGQTGEAGAVTLSG